MLYLRAVQFWAWLGAPWTKFEREHESDELDRLTRELAARGAAVSGMAERGQARIIDRHARRRRRMRVLAVLIVVVAASAFLTAFTDNRVVHGISIAATASAAPIALMLGLRRAEES